MLSKVNDLQRIKWCIRLNNGTVSQLRGIYTWICLHRPNAIGPITKPWTVLFSMSVREFKNTEIFGFISILLIFLWGGGGGYVCVFDSSLYMVDIQ